MKYGNLPIDLGEFPHVKTDEMMFWLYLPVSLPGSSKNFLPDNLKSFELLLHRIFHKDKNRYINDFVYLTVKTLWVPQGASPNRPGWHTDGFGTDDVNYIWYSDHSTQFFEDSFELPANCNDAMGRMAIRASDKELITYPNKHLLRLDPSVVHRVNPSPFEGMRTFVKVSISPDLYDLKGNSVNHEFLKHGLFPPSEMRPRDSIRNHPSRK